MKNLTTPQAILFGLGLIALSISSIPYSTKLVTPAFASNSIKSFACDFSKKTSRLYRNPQILYRRCVLVRSREQQRKPAFTRSSSYSVECKFKA